MSWKRILVIKELPSNPPVYVVTGVKFVCSADEVLKEVTRWVNTRDPAEIDRGQNTVQTVDSAPGSVTSFAWCAPVSPDYSPTTPDCPSVVPTACVTPYEPTCSNANACPFLLTGPNVKVTPLPGNSPGPEDSDEEWGELPWSEEQEREWVRQAEEQKGETEPEEVSGPADVITIEESEAEFEPDYTVEGEEPPESEEESEEGEVPEGDAEGVEEGAHSIWEDIRRKVGVVTERQDQQLAQCRTQLEEVQRQVRELKQGSAEKERRERARGVAGRKAALDAEIRKKTDELYALEREIKEKKGWIGPVNRRALPEQNWWAAKLKEGLEITVLWMYGEPQFQVNVRGRQKARERASHLITTRREIAIQRAIEELCTVLQIEEQIRHDLIDQLHKKDGPKRKRRRKRGRRAVRETVVAGPSAPGESSGVVNRWWW